MAVSKKHFKISGLLFLLPFFFFINACTVVKNYPQKQPFIYQTNVHVEGEFSDDQRKELALQLEDQLHDSVRVRSVAKAIGWDKGPRLFYEVLNHPVVFDSLNADKSIQFMRALLNSIGYFRDSIQYTVRVDTASNGNQFRTYLDFYVYPRVVTKLDSIAYRMNADTSAITVRQRQNLDTIQKITWDNLPGSLIKKGDPFSIYKLSAERDRLADVYRNNGYLRFSEEELLVLWDTVGVDLLRPTLDPIEQANLLQRLAERRANPVADVEYRLRENPDSTRITRYYVGKVTVYPEFTTDTTDVYRYSDTASGYIIKHNNRLFKKNIFPDYIFLNPGELYRQSNFLKTQNKFNALNAWRIINIQQRPRTGQDTADFTILLTPARKYGFNANFEVSRNQGNISFAQGNLIGLGFTTGVQNRNFRRGANQSSLTFRFGTELNSDIGDLIQSSQINLGYSLQMPRLVPKGIRFLSKNKENVNASVFSLNAGQTDRRDYYNLTTISSSWGYQFSWDKHLVNFRFPNIEYNYLVKRDSLIALIQRNVSYQYIFNTGMITSMLGNWSVAGGSGDITNLKSLSVELAGLPGFLRNAFATTLYRFIKVDAEFRQTHKLFRNALAWRVFGGVGLSLPFSSSDFSNRFLPFFREYFAGGPNSMRAWSIRKLGPGSSIRTFDNTDAPERFGDIRLEGNLEYRIFLASYKGIGINTAVYTDIGNIWFLRNNPDFEGGDFPDSFSKLGKDIAIGMGTGLRLDFGFLKIRLDYAYKVKDPTPDNLGAQNKWFYDWGLFNGQVQLGIDYPF
jgi:outer membrane protein insertion porin family